MKILPLIILFALPLRQTKEPLNYSIPFENKATFINSMAYQQQSRAAVSGEISAIVSLIQGASKMDNPPIYDLTHQLLVPLVYAGESDNQVLLNNYDSLFSPQLVDKVVDIKQYGLLNSLHFMYLTSEYLRYRYPTIGNDIKDRNDKYYQEIKSFIWRFWTQDKGNVWDSEPFMYQGRRSRIAYLLTNSLPSQNKSYFSAITDFELFTMAIGTSLAGYELQHQGKVSDEMAEIVYYFMEVLHKKVTFYSDNRWLMQPGVWSDNSDYKYAGNAMSSLNLSEKPVKNIAWDVSHFSRMPGYLNTLSAVFVKQSSNALYISRLKIGLANQFANVVATPPDQETNIYRFKNFMDGSNGIFRYNYSKSLPLGYGPYSNSTHVFFGWWKLLDAPGIDRIYKSMYNNFDAQVNNDLIKTNPKTAELYKEIVGL